MPARSFSQAANRLNQAANGVRIATEVMETAHTEYFEEAYDVCGSDPNCLASFDIDPESVARFVGALQAVDEAHRNLVEARDALEKAAEVLDD